MEYILFDVEFIIIFPATVIGDVKVVANVDNEKLLELLLCLLMLSRDLSPKSNKQTKSRPLML